MERMDAQSVNCGQMSAPILTFSFTMNLLLFSCLSNDVDEAATGVDNLFHRATLKCEFHLI
jgi:hypothetical protein